MRATALLSTGGSTNHLIHLPAIARAAGIMSSIGRIWTGFRAVVPLLTRVYPNGSADVNAFEDAGGPPFVIRELLAGGLAHADILTIARGRLCGLCDQAGHRRRRRSAGVARAAGGHPRRQRSCAPSTGRSSPMAG